MTDMPAVAASCQRDDGRESAPVTMSRPVRRWLGPRSAVFAAAVLCLTAAVLGEPVADELDLAELGNSLAAVVSATHLQAISQSLRVRYLSVLGALAALHYVAAAVAVMAVAGLRGRVGEIGLAQLAAAAANRITPLGLGAGAVNVCYLCRRGSSPAQAVGAVAALGVFLVSSAVASSFPTPAGIGATEGALVAVLLLAHDTTAHAVQAVLLFRLVTFWAPVPLGLLAAGALRRRGML